MDRGQVGQCRVRLSLAFLLAQIIIDQRIVADTNGHVIRASWWITKSHGVDRIGRALPGSAIPLRPQIYTVSGRPACRNLDGEVAVRIMILVPSRPHGCGMRACCLPPTHSTGAEHKNTDDQQRERRESAQVDSGLPTPAGLIALHGAWPLPRCPAV